jgi:hypothetical protein
VVGIGRATQSGSAGQASVSTHSLFLPHRGKSPAPATLAHSTEKIP